MLTVVDLILKAESFKIFTPREPQNLLSDVLFQETEFVVEIRCPRLLRADKARGIQNVSNILGNT